MPTRRVALPCRICEDESQRGGSVTLTVFVRLTQHLKCAHGMTAEQAKKMSNLARLARGRKMGNSQRSLSGKKFVQCVLDG